MLVLTLPQILTRLVALLVIIAVHGFCLALLARLLGDRGPKYDGRLSFNPFEHIDFLAVIPFVLFQVGWIRPIAVDAKLLRGGVIGLLAVVLGALLATLAVGAALAAAQVLVLTVVTDASFASGAANVLRTMLEMSIWFALFNLIPIPPLAAGMVPRALLPALAARLDTVSLVVRIALIAGLATGVFQSTLRPVFDAILAALTVGG